MVKRRDSHRVAFFWIAPCIGAWALIPTLAQDPGNLTSHQYLFWSSLVSAVCLLACTAMMGRWSALRAYSSTDLRRLIALAALGAFGYYALLYSAYAPCAGKGCPEKATIIIVAQYTWPALSVCWSVILLKERITPPLVVALLLGVLAVAIGASTGASSREAVAKLPVVLLAAIVFGLYSTLLKRVDYEPFSSQAVSFGAATVMALAATMWFSGGAGEPNAKAVLAIAINGVFVNGLSYVWWYRALHAAPISFVAPWVALTPVLATMVAAPSVLLGAGQWTALGLILLSVLLVTTRARKRDRTARRSPYRLMEESV
jgi:drug/metabolite transporter (DMT)-like permease